MLKLNSFKSLSRIRKFKSPFAIQSSKGINEKGGGFSSELPLTLRAKKAVKYIYNIYKTKTLQNQRVLVPITISTYWKNSKNLYERVLYQFQKRSLKYQTPIRNICKTFLIYVFGSFCWLYLPLISTQRSRFYSQKTNFIFKEKIFKHLPLFSQQSLYRKETVDTYFPLETKKDNRRFKRLKNGLINIEVSPDLYDFVIQNYIGYNLSSKVEGKKLLFFARKPLLKETFGKTKGLIQPYLYNYSGTTLIVNSEIDILPRRAEDLNRSCFLNLDDKTDNRRFNTSVKFDPELRKVEKIQWCPPFTENLYKKETKAGLNSSRLILAHRINSSDIFSFGSKLKSTTARVLNSKPTPLRETYITKRVNRSPFFNPFIFSRLQSGYNFPDAFVTEKKKTNWTNNISIKSQKKSFTEGLNFAVPTSSSSSPFNLFSPFLGEKDLASNKDETGNPNFSELPITQKNFSQKDRFSAFNIFSQNKNLPFLELAFEARPLQSYIKYSEDFYKHSVPSRKNIKYSFIKGFKELLTDSPNNLPSSKRLVTEGRDIQTFDCFLGHKKDFYTSLFLKNNLGGLDFSKEDKSQFLLTSSPPPPNLKGGEPKFLLCRERVDPHLKEISAPNNLRFFLSTEIFHPLISLDSNSTRSVSNLEPKTPQAANSLNLKGFSQPYSLIPLKEKSYNSLKKPGNLFSKLSRETLSPNFIDLFRSNPSYNQKRKDFFCDDVGPENFFGMSYLQLGERFTIEKLTSQNQISFFYNIHNGNSSYFKKYSPFVTGGTSLKTVFGKKWLFSSKKNLKTLKKDTKARLVSRWNLSDFSNNKKIYHGLNERFETSWLKGSNRVESLWDPTYLTPLDKKTKSGNLEVKNLQECLYFKRISGKTNSYIINPFKYYNPGTKRERNIEDTLLTLEGYRKSRLFPKVSMYEQGIGAPIGAIDVVGPKEIDLKPQESQKFIGLKGSFLSVGPKSSNFSGLDFPQGLNCYINGDLDTQSILAGMRQRTPVERIAENVTGAPQDELEKGRRSEETPQSSLLKKKNYFTNNYPLQTLLLKGSQKSYPKSFKPLDKTEYSFNGLILRSNEQTCPLGLSLPFYPLSFSNQKVLGEGETTGLPQTKGFYFEKIFTNVKFKTQKVGKGGILDNLKTLSFYSTGKVNFRLFKRPLLVFFSKWFFFFLLWSSYKNLGIWLINSTQFLPPSFTELIGLDSFGDKFRIIAKTKTVQNFRNLAGAEQTLAELRNLIWTFCLIGTKNPGDQNLFRVFPYIGSQRGKERISVGFKNPNRFLLVGPPGTGKTLLVKTLAFEANVPVIVQPVSQLQAITGVENPVSALFHVARQIKPCIIFLDELDTLGNNLEKGEKATPERKLGLKFARKYTYSLLLELDGLTSSTRDLLIIGATNRPETLNPALTRSGRFETTIECNLPKIEQCRSVLSLYLTLWEKKRGESLSLTSNSNRLIPTTKKDKAVYGVNWFLSKTNLFFSRKNQNYQREVLFRVYYKTPWDFLKPYSFETDLEVIKPLEVSKKQKGFYVNYISKQCYGLSQASIETVVNESALQSMLSNYEGFNHTLKSLQRAIEAVCLLTSRGSQGLGSLDGFPSFIDLPITPSEGVGLQKGPGYSESCTEERFRNEGLKNKKKEGFGLYKAYQIAGSFIFKNKLYSKGFLFEKKSLGRSTTTPQKDFERKLKEQYAKEVSSHLYSSRRPQILKFSDLFGLWADPITSQSNFYIFKYLTTPLWSQSFAKETLPVLTFGSKETLNLPMDAKVNLEENNFSFSPNGLEDGSLLEKRGEEYTSASLNPFKVPHFVSATKLVKQNIKTNRDYISQNSGLKESTRSAPLKKRKTSGFNIQLSRQVKNSKKLTASWFRLYLSRPIFRYDDNKEYIENKEYYPKNNYAPITRRFIFRNFSIVANRVRTSVLSPVFRKNSILTARVKFRGLKYLNKNEWRALLVKGSNSFFYYSEPSNLSNFNFKPKTVKSSSQFIYLGQEVYSLKGLYPLNKPSPLNPFQTSLTDKLGRSQIFSQQASSQSHTVVYNQKNYNSELKSNPSFDSIFQRQLFYLAFAALTFNKGLVAIEKNRELIDYCVYNILRYGLIYDFSVNKICKNF